LEILVSLAILGLVLPVVLYAFSNSAHTRGVADARMTAAYLLRDKMSEIEATGVPEVGQESGEFEAGTRYAWESTVADTDTEGLYDVVVTVRWMESGRERAFSTRAYIADPAVGQTGAAAQAAGGNG
jgi:type II secretion system protein I